MDITADQLCVYLSVGKNTPVFFPVIRLSLPVSMFVLGSSAVCVIDMID
jgi:hypothetical protein